MQKDEFKAGEFWAYRKSTSLEHPAERVELSAVSTSGPYHGRSRCVTSEGELEGLEELRARAAAALPLAGVEKGRT